MVLDRVGGVSIEHCEQVSKKISAALDVLDFADSGYVLEVGSPGLDRKLYQPKDYQRFEGRLARVTWQDPATGKRTDVGRLEVEMDPGSERPDTIHLSLDNGSTVAVPFSAISEARLEIEL